VDISITKVKTEQSCWLQTGNVESELVPDLQLSSIHARADRKAEWSSEPQPPTQQPPEEASVLFNKLSQRQKTGSHFLLKVHSALRPLRSPSLKSRLQAGTSALFSRTSTSSGPSSQQPQDVFTSRPTYEGSAHPHCRASRCSGVVCRAEDRHHQRGIGAGCEPCSRGVLWPIA